MTKPLEIPACDAPPPVVSSRRVWGRSLTLAVTLHLTFVVWWLRPAELDRMANPRLPPLVNGELVVAPTVVSEQDITPPAAPEERAVAGESKMPVDGQLAAPTTIEPDSDTIRQAVRTLMAASQRAPDATSYEELIRKAHELEQLSSPQEVGRMADAIRGIFDARDIPTTETSSLLRELSTSTGSW